MKNYLVIRQNIVYSVQGKMCHRIDASKFWGHLEVKKLPGMIKEGFMKKLVDFCFILMKIEKALLSCETSINIKGLE